MLEQVTEEHFDETFGVNVRGTLFPVQKALPLLNDGASVISGSDTAPSGHGWRQGHRGRLTREGSVPTGG
ncbi:hypothetical protein [Nonomuraea sp. 10N515B]|uniref:hypothetical protein n=1 Tax=Nonomuraea sp. 10N515B TaxID=3457422 RepID=UPI003FCEC5CE